MVIFHGDVSHNQRVYSNDLHKLDETDMTSDNHWDLANN